MRSKAPARNPAARCSLPESEMRAVLVVVTNIQEQPLQTLFIHCDDVIQQVLVGSFRPNALPRRFARDSRRRSAQDSSSAIKTVVGKNRTATGTSNPYFPPRQRSGIWEPT